MSSLYFFFFAFWYIVFCKLNHKPLTSLPPLWAISMHPCSIYIKFGFPFDLGESCIFFLQRVDPERTLTDAQRDEFEDMLRALTLERSQVKDAMGFSLDNADAAGEVCNVF